MNFRPNRREEPLLDITPLIDVVFLLLIFFMVSTSFSIETEMNIELPEATGKPLQTINKPIEIGIDRQGHYFVDHRQLVNDDIETLKRALSKVVADRKQPQLIISSDRKAPYQAVITAMDAARQVGLDRLTFATRQAVDKKQP